jgi:hypothetical protein
MEIFLALYEMWFQILQESPEHMPDPLFVIDEPMRFEYLM